MKRAIVLGLVIFAHDARAQSPLTFGQVLGRVRAVYGTGAVAADFTQEYTAKAYGVTRTTSGHVVLSSSGKTDWRYVTPAGARVVSDASHVCSYDVAARTLQLEVASDSWLGLVAPLLTAQPNTTFNLTLAKPLPWGYVIVAQPATPTAVMSFAMLYIDANTFEIRRVLVVDNQRNRFKLDLANTQRNASVTASQFVIRPPPNATFLGPNGQTALPPTCP